MSCTLGSWLQLVRVYKQFQLDFCSIAHRWLSHKMLIRYVNLLGYKCGNLTFCPNFILAKNRISRFVNEQCASRGPGPLVIRLVVTRAPNCAAALCANYQGAGGHTDCCCARIHSLWRDTVRELLTAASGGAEKRLCCQVFHSHNRSRDVCAWSEGECTCLGSQVHGFGPNQLQILCA